MDKLNYFTITKNYGDERIFKIAFDGEILDDWIISSFYLFKRNYYDYDFNDDKDVLISSINEYANQFVNSITQYNTFIQFRSNWFNDTLGLKEQELNNGNVSIIESPKLINNKNREKILENLFDPNCYLILYDKFANDDDFKQEIIDTLDKYKHKINDYLKQHNNTNKGR